MYFQSYTNNLSKLIVFVTASLLLILCSCASRRPLNTYTCPPGGAPCRVSGMANMTDEEWAAQAKMVSQRQAEYTASVAAQESEMANAQNRRSSEITARGTLFKKGFCYQTFPLRYLVNQKLDKNHYGAVTEMRSPELMSQSRHAVIEMEH